MTAITAGQHSLFDALPVDSEAGNRAPMPATSSVEAKRAHFVVKGPQGHRNIELVSGGTTVTGIHGFSGDKRQWQIAVRWCQEDAERLGYQVVPFTDWGRLSRPKVKQISGLAED